MNSDVRNTRRSARRKLKSRSNGLRLPKKRSNKSKGKGREQVSIGFATIHENDNADDFV
jgi:hypothetical protein